MARIHRQPTENGENGHVKHSEGNGTAPHNTTTTTEQQQQQAKKYSINNNNHNNNTQFVSRVSSIPLVKDSVSTAQAIANKTFLGRFAISQANATLNTVTYYAGKNKPIQTYYQYYVQPQLERVDALGCRSLDVIQEKVPIINQPTQDIYQHVVKNPSSQIIDGVKIRLDSTISTVTHPAHVVIQETNKRLGAVVDNLEDAVYKYLPSTTTEHQDDDDDVVAAKKRQATSITSNNNNNQVVRVYGVLNEASRRITHKVTQQANKSGIPTSRQDLSRLAESNVLVQNVTENIRLLQETLIHSITVYGTAVQEHLPVSVTTRVQQTTVLISSLTLRVHEQLNHLVGFVKKQQIVLPDWLKTKLNTLIESTYQQLELIKKEFSRNDIQFTDKIKHVAHHLQSQILPLLEQISSQLATYSHAVRDKAQHVPLHYFGSVHQKTQ